jgi:hypothetical protein
LWAELLIISESSDPSVLIDCWHVDPDEAFDFMDGPNRLEVKSFSGDARVHRFSLRQVRPGGGVVATVASVRAERGAGGATVADLITTIRVRGISAEAVLKLDTIVARSLGDVAATGLSLAFDLERGRASIGFFDALTVPSVNPALPFGVSHVRFDAVLGETHALPIAVLRERGRLAAAAAPRG